MAMAEKNRNSGHSIIHHMLKPSKCQILLSIDLFEGFSLLIILEDARRQIMFERHFHEGKSFIPPDPKIKFLSTGKTNFLPSSCSRYVALHSSCLLNPDVKFIHRSSSSLCELRIILLY